MFKVPNRTRRIFKGSNLEARYIEFWNDNIAMLDKKIKENSNKLEPTGICSPDVYHSISNYCEKASEFIDTLLNSNFYNDRSFSNFKEDSFMQIGTDLRAYKDFLLGNNYFFPNEIEATLEKLFNVQLGHYLANTSYKPI